MPTLQLRTGTVRSPKRTVTVWRGAAGPPDTRFGLGSVVAVFPRPVSLGEGDLVTVVGRRRSDGFAVEALRNDSTAVSYPARTGTAVACLLGLIGALWAVPLVAGRAVIAVAIAWLTWRVVLGHLANTVLRAASPP